MKTNKSKWLAYTVLVGLIPVISRLLVWAVTRDGAVAPLAATDFIAFGLVLHISNINELEHAPVKDKQWKTMQNGISVVFIAFYSVLFAVTLLAERSPNLFSTDALLVCVVFLALTSLALSFSVLHRLTVLGRRDG